MTYMQWITFAMYVIVLAIWAVMLLRLLRARKDASKTARKNLIIMTGIVVALTALQFLGHRQ